MTKKVMNCLGKAVADEMSARGLNRTNMFMTNVVANLTSAVVMSAVSLAVDGAVAGVKALRANRAAAREARELEEEFAEIDTEEDFCEVPPTQAAPSAAEGSQA